MAHRKGGSKAHHMHMAAHHAHMAAATKSKGKKRRRGRKSGGISAAMHRGTSSGARHATKFA